MENREQKGYNFNSVDLLIYIWNKRLVLMIVGLVAAIGSMVISLTITPMFSSSVIMFPASNASVARGLAGNELQWKSERLWIRRRGSGRTTAPGITFRAHPDPHYREI